MKTKILPSLILTILALGVIEAWLRDCLFDYASYSNSESIDVQLEARDTIDDWRMIFIGDSETRWGINPFEIDRAFQTRGIDMKSFNHAFDGFGASWWPRLLPKLLEQPSLRRVESVVLGVQMIDVHRIEREGGLECGELQRPVLSSPMATDLGINGLCKTRTWDADFGRKLFGGLWIVRYSSAVRTLVLPQSIFGKDQLKVNSRKLGEPYRGFQAHRSISHDPTNFDAEFIRWKAQYVPERDFRPLPVDSWRESLSEGGFFDELNQLVQSSGRKLLLFALPTNPVLIDTFKRRQDYTRNSAMLSKWAIRNRVDFIDLGIKDSVDADEFFSDMRHLSGYGAKTYSQALGSALAAVLMVGTDQKKNDERGDQGHFGHFVEQ
jgi:hypothetical protein